MVDCKDPQRLDPDRANGQEWKMHGKHNIDAPDCIDGEKVFTLNARCAEMTYRHGGSCFNVVLEPGEPLRKR